MNYLLEVAQRNIRSYIKLSGLDENSKRAALNCVEVMESALTPPDGYVVVPVEPTESMIDSAMDQPVGACWNHQGDRDDASSDDARRVWAAMIAARPEVP